MLPRIVSQKRNDSSRLFSSACMHRLLTLLTFFSLHNLSIANTCATAISVSCGTNETGSTVGEPNGGLGTCGTSTGSGGMMWYTFTGDGSSWTFETVATTGQYDTKIWVYSGSCGSLTCITGNDDGGSGTLSLVNFTAALGTTYYVIVGGYSANEGNYDLSITASPCAPPTPMTYTSSAVTQANTTDVESCELNAEIIGIEVVMGGGSLTPLDITSFRLRTDNSTAPLTDVSNVDIYYTGTSATFATTSLFGSSAPAATGVNFDVNGTQTLSPGTNYFWVVYDLASNATVGNDLDARCNRITVDGTNNTPSPVNPGGLRTIVSCTPSPGNVGAGNLTAWFKADDLSSGDVTSWSTSYPSGGSAITLSDQDGAAPYAQNTTTPSNAIFNYNAVVDFSGNTDANRMQLTNTSSIDLLTNQYSSSTGSFFCVFASASSGNNDGVVTYKNGLHGIQMRGWGRLAIGETNSTYGCRNFTPKAATVPAIMGYKGNKSSSTSMVAYMDDTEFTNSSGSAAAMSNGLTFGAKRNSTTTYNEYFTGFLSEVIFFNNTISDAEVNRISSYLAIKYGVSLDNSGGGTSGDYTSSTGDNLWDADNNSSYHNNVIGIGRDDYQGLNQKQSHSFNDSTRIYLGTLSSSNAGNASSFSNNNSYVLIGDNQDEMNATASSNTEMPASCGMLSRLTREWKITRTNMTDDFNIDLTLSSSAIPSLVTSNHLSLLVDDDGDFSNGGTTCFTNGDGSGIVISYSNPVVTISNISSAMIANNATRFFTVGSAFNATPLPVGVSSFDANCNENKATLNWITSSETNNNYFTISKSVDGITFEESGKVYGAGNSSQTISYEWIDPVSNSDEVYYRLSQTDFDGSITEISNTKVNCTIDKEIKLYPNPFKNELVIESENEGMIQLIDNSGKVIVTSKVSIGTSAIDVSGLASGAYVSITMLDNGQRIVKKVMKL